jgi:hypothetical protein
LEIITRIKRKNGFNAVIHPTGMPLFSKKTNTPYNHAVVLRRHLFGLCTGSHEDPSIFYPD